MRCEAAVTVCRSTYGPTQRPRSAPLLFVCRRYAMATKNPNSLVSRGSLVVVIDAASTAVMGNGSMAALERRPQEPSLARPRSRRFPQADYKPARCIAHRDDAAAHRAGRPVSPNVFASRGPASQARRAVLWGWPSSAKLSLSGAKCTGHPTRTPPRGPLAPTGGKRLSGPTGAFTASLRGMRVG